MPQEKIEQQPPRVFGQLKSWLQQHYLTLPKRLQSVAIYALHYPDMIALNTIAVISEQVEVTPSTIIRFAKSLGYQGFSDMQTVFQQSMRHIPQPYAERIHDLDEQLPHQTTAMQCFAVAATSSIDKLKQINDQSLLQASRRLAEAYTVYIAGQGRAAPLSSYLHYMLIKMGMQAVILEGIPALIADKARLIGRHRDEVLLAISFSPYAANTRDLVDICTSRQVPVVSITDSSLSPIARQDVLYFDVLEDEVAGFRGLSATMCLAQCLAVEAGKYRSKIDNVLR